MIKTNEGPMRWKFWKRFERYKLFDKLTEGHKVYLVGDWISIRFLIIFALFCIFEFPLTELDDKIQFKKYAKGYNLRRKGQSASWDDL